MTIRRQAYLVVCACAALAMLCNEPPTIVRTGGSEVVGTLVRQNGTPVAGAVVHLDTAAYSSDTTYVALDSTITDSKGAFSFRRMHGAGFFSIYGDYHSSELVALLRALKDTASPTTFHKVDVGTHAMFPPGFISGKVVIDETSMTGTICYIPGTSLMAITGDDGSFVISGVPVDTYRVFFAYPDYLVGRDSGVIVKSGDTTDVGTILLNYDPNKALTEINTKVNAVLNQLPKESQQPVINLSTGETIGILVRICTARYLRLSEQPEGGAEAGEPAALVDVVARMIGE